MKKAAVITARVDEETLAGLDRLAAGLERSRSWLVAKAVEQFVKEGLEFHAFLQEGEDAIDRGDFLTHEEMVAWIEGLRRTADAA